MEEKDSPSHRDEYIIMLPPPYPHLIPSPSLVNYWASSVHSIISRNGLAGGKLKKKGDECGWKGAEREKINKKWNEHALANQSIMLLASLCSARMRAERSNRRRHQHRPSERCYDQQRWCWSGGSRWSCSQVSS